jgi:hypothetical protein
MKLGTKIHSYTNGKTLCGYVGHMTASTPERPTPYKTVTCKVCIRKLAANSADTDTTQTSAGTDAPTATVRA